MAAERPPASVGGPRWRGGGARGRREPAAGGGALEAAASGMPPSSARPCAGSSEGGAADWKRRRLTTSSRNSGRSSRPDWSASYLSRIACACGISAWSPSALSAERSCRWTGAGSSERVRSSTGRDRVERSGGTGPRLPQGPPPCHPQAVSASTPPLCVLAVQEASSSRGQRFKRPAVQETPTA